MLTIKFSSRSQAGFTLIELVFVIIVVGIMSVSVYLSLPSTVINLNYEARRVLANIRYAQGLSITSGQHYSWVKLSANTYSINSESGAAIVLPTGGTQVTLANGVTFGSLANLPNNLVAFDSRGIPCSTATVPGTPLASAASISLTGGGSSRTITITPQTGYGVVQ